MAARYWTHQEYRTPHENGRTFWEESGLDANGQLMVFDSYDGAVEMAKWMLEGDGSVAWSVAEGLFPAVGILAHDHDPSVDEDDLPDDASSWGDGSVVNFDGTPSVRRDLPIEDDPFVWDRAPEYAAAFLAA